MMLQYRNAKAELSSDTLLLFRMGDFYELFFDDAVRGSELLEIALTKRSGIAMAGIPFHSLNNYLPKILEAGVKVAIAEQMEDPKLAKGIVKREITQIITPGTIIDGNVLSSQKSNFLVSIYASKKRIFGMATLDISTGDFRITELESKEGLETEIHRLQPAECIVPEYLYKEWELKGFPEVNSNVSWTSAEDWTFDPTVSLDLLKRHFGVASLDGFGGNDFPTAIQAAGAILHYAQNNLRRNADHITHIAPYSCSDAMVIDQISQRNLELVEPLFSDSKNSTLLSVLDQTITPMGSRMIREWILRPLLDIKSIEFRLDAIDVFVRDQLLLLELREALKAVKDLERTISRLNVGAANARDLVVLQRALDAVPAIKSIISMDSQSEMLNTIQAQLNDLPEINEMITKAIVEDPPLTVKEGGIITEGFHNYLDELRCAAKEGKNWIADLQKKEQSRTTIKSLKVRYNKVFGYYIEVSKSNLDLVPENYLRKQTLVNAERFITPELKEIEDKIIGAEDKAKALEYELFQEIRTKIIAETARIQLTARAIAGLDTIGALAQVALKNSYKRPRLNTDIVIEIQGGRHPVIDNFIEDEPFVPNDTVLNDTTNQMLIITGPNMAGKSTYIRQVALLVIMTQMGSYIPVEAANIGIADRIFTRIGASDDLSRGQSTFMVEMIETARILNNATPKSLVVLDEIGRGTSTFDGLSIAWAVAEYIHNNAKVRSRTLFATHYHELTELSLTLPGVKNYNVAVSESGDEIRFLRKIMAGAADKSYGIHVARLAGLPKPVIERAQEVLTNLEGNAIDTVDHQPKLAKRSKKKKLDPTEQLTLFDW